jgi:hypothetical protein
VDEVLSDAAQLDAEVGQRMMRAFRDGQDPASLVRG